MAKVRVQPHLMASSRAVKWASWYLAIESERYQLGPILDGWDYDQSIRIGTSPDIDVAELMRSTGLDDATEVHLVMTVDCSPTSRRFVSHRPLDLNLSSPDQSIEVEIPRGAAALELKMTCHLALMAHRPPSGNAPCLKGSRIAESPTTRLVLEGDASRFPTEALSFLDLRWEPAAWSVRIDMEDMNEAFRGVVRLFLNTDHAVGAALASMDSKTYGALGSILRIHIVRSILLAGIEQVGRMGTEAFDFDEESFGSVAEQISNDYFGMGLAAVAELKSADNTRFERVLQSSVGLDVMLA